MIAFPPAKINLGLNVVWRRSDGYHDIESVMVPVPLFDALEMVVDSAIPSGQVEYTRSGLQVPGDVGADLVIRAHGLLRERHDLPGIRIHLHKAIPMGAGLGGGSSDGAHALMLLDRLLALGCAPSELAGMALSLGSDCPFFLQGAPMLAQGRGERLSPAGLRLSGVWLVLLNPGVHVSTAEVYSNIKATGSEWDLAARLASEPMEQWRSAAPNVMEEFVMAKEPAVFRALEFLRTAGASHFAMSGSGATVFGLFRDRPFLPDWPQGCTGWVLRL